MTKPYYQDDWVTLYDPVSPECAEWANWLDARAAAYREEGE